MDVLEKRDLVFDVLGTVDELNSHIGMVASFNLKNSITNQLHQIQKNLFAIGATIACDKKSSITEHEITRIEKAIDQWSENLPAMTHFILPTGSLEVSQCHITRAVCRRAERLMWKINDKKAVDERILIYLNRLSDYLFILARKITSDLNIEEIKWQ